MAGGAARGGGRAQGRPPKKAVEKKVPVNNSKMARGAARGGGRARGRPPKKAVEKKVPANKNKMAGGAARGGGRARGRQPEKVVEKKVPVKPAKSKPSVGQNKKKVQPQSDSVSARNAPQKSVRSKRNCADKSHLANVGRLEALHSQDKPSPAKKRKLGPTTSLASPSHSQKKKVSAEVGKEDKVGNSSYSTTDPQGNKHPICPKQGVVDFWPNGFNNNSCTVFQAQNTEPAFNRPCQIQKSGSDGSAVVEDTIEVSKIHEISTNKNTTVPILNENNAAASQVEDINTSNVLKATPIHGKKKQPWVCVTCSRHYFRKDQFLDHVMNHTREKLRHVQPKRQHQKKYVSAALSDPVGLVGSLIIEKTTKVKEGSLLDNEEDQIDATSNQENEVDESIVGIENFPDGNRVDILYDKTEIGKKDKLDTTVNVSDDEDMSIPSNSTVGNLINSPTCLATNYALSSSPIVTDRTKPSFGNKISKVNPVETVTVIVSDDEELESSNSKVQKLKKKFVKKRLFTYQPLRQNQIPNGGSENKTKDNPCPINNDCRSSYGEALDRIKLLGPSVSLIKTTSPCDTSRTEEKRVVDLFKDTENTVKSAKECFPLKRVTPPCMREPENTVKRLNVCLPLTRATSGTEVTENTRKRVKVCLPQSRATSPCETINVFEDENDEAFG